MPVTNSVWKSPCNDVFNYSGYDEKQKINWSVRNDSNYLYVLIGTSEQSARARILRGEITLYIDTTGKKKEDFYLKCSGVDMPFMPKREKPKDQAGEVNPDGTMQEKKPEKVFPKINISGKFKEATLKNGDAEYFIAPRFEKTNLICLYSLDSLGYMLCTFGIPLKTIYEYSEWLPEKRLSVGIDINSSSGKHEHQGQNNGDSYQHGGGGGMRGGGMGGGGMHGGGGGHGSHGGGGGSNYTEPERIWFITSLAKHE
jgi:hypothetical protein